MGGGHENKVEQLPPNFRFSPDDRFYLAPPFCHLLHYRAACLPAVAFEIICLASGLWALTQCSEFLALWVVLLFAALLLMAVVSGAMMVFAVINDKPAWFLPKMLILQLEIFVLMVVALVAIVAMSIGIEATAWLFSFILKVSVMEPKFGPIWPFNIAAVSFFGAAISVWCLAIVRGAQDYVLDKEYFMKQPTVEMTPEKKAPKP